MAQQLSDEQVAEFKEAFSLFGERAGGRGAMAVARRGGGSAAAERIWGLTAISTRGRSAARCCLTRPPTPPALQTRTVSGAWPGGAVNGVGGRAAWGLPVPACRLDPPAPLIAASSAAPGPRRRCEWGRGEATGPGV